MITLKTSHTEMKVNFTNLQIQFLEVRALFWKEIDHMAFQTLWDTLWVKLDRRVYYETMISLKGEKYRETVG